MSITLRAKRILTGALAGALVLGLLPAGVASANTDVCDGAGSAGFSDSASATHQGNIDCIAAYDVISGRADGTFGGSASITRGAFATMIARFAQTATGDALPMGTNSFTDVAGNVHANNIARIVEADIASGRTDTSFAPNDTITRAEAATMLRRAHSALGVTFTDAPADFADVSGTHANNINILGGAGVITGTGGNLFSPNRSITRAETATLLVRSARVLDDAGLWTADRLVEATTNQTFTVTADTVFINSDDAEANSRTYTAQVGSASSVRIALIDVANLDDPPFTVNAQGKVVFTDGGLTDDDVDFDAATAITTVTTGTGAAELQVTTTAAAAFTVANVVGGVVTFTLETESAALVPIVYATTPETGTALPTEDGEPTLDFGIGGATYFFDLNKVEIAVALSGDVTNAGLAPFGGTLTAEVNILSNNGGFVLPASGQQILVYAAQYETEVARDPAEAAFEPFDDPAVTFGSDNLIVNGAAITVGANGVASFSWTGPADPAISPGGGDELFQAIGFAFAGSGVFADADKTVTDKVDFTDATPVATAVNLAGSVDADAFISVSSSLTLSATVTDQFGRPLAGQTVTFVDDDDYASGNRTTNASGVATAVVTSTDSGAVKYTATAGGVIDTFDVTWFEAPEADQNFGDPDAEAAAAAALTAALVGLDADAGLVFIKVEDGADVFVFGVSYDAAAFFAIAEHDQEEYTAGPIYITKAAWVTAVTDAGPGDGGVFIVTAGYGDADTANQIWLVVVEDGE